jgi:hydrogenase nickel incorporation protein HypA/HybF
MEVASLHELSIACEIIEQVMSTAEAHGATEVKHVTLQMGRLSHTNPEQLSFCFKVLAEGSIAENADFIVEMVPPSLECECGYTGTIDETQIRESNELKSELLVYVAAMECPACGKQAHITGGRELIIKSIEIETEKEDKTAECEN